MVIGASVTNMQWVAQVRRLLAEGEELEYVSLAAGVGFDLSLVAVTPLRVLGFHRTSAGPLEPVLEVPLADVKGVEVGPRSTLVVHTAEGQRLAARFFVRQDLLRVVEAIDRLRAGGLSAELSSTSGRTAAAARVTQDAAQDEIIAWVMSGGVLILLGWILGALAVDHGNGYLWLVAALVGSVGFLVLLVGIIGKGTQIGIEASRTTRRL